MKVQFAFLLFAACLTQVRAAKPGTGEFDLQEALEQEHGNPRVVNGVTYPSADPMSPVPAGRSSAYTTPYGNRPSSMTRSPERRDSQVRNASQERGRSRGRSLPRQSRRFSAENSISRTQSSPPSIDHPEASIDHPEPKKSASSLMPGKKTTIAALIAALAAAGYVHERNKVDDFASKTYQQLVDGWNEGKEEAAKAADALKAKVEDAKVDLAPPVVQLKEVPAN